MSEEEGVIEDWKEYETTLKTDPPTKGKSYYKQIGDMIYLRFTLPGSDKKEEEDE